MVSFKRIDSDNNKASDCSNSLFLEEAVSFEKGRPKRLKLEMTIPYKNILSNGENNTHLKAKDDESLVQESNPAKSLAELEIFFSPTRQIELDAAALRVQKAYKGYQTRRNLADCAVVVEELWWKALDFAALKQSSVSFFNIEKPESAASRWARARTRAAKVGKGLSKDEKAQKLALVHWLEAIDPRHRYGHNLHFYYEVWFNSQSSQPFFYWLDVGDGREINLDKCQRLVLQHECIKYLGPKEREAYEVIIDSGKLVYKQSGVLIDTMDDGSKWIFVLSTMRILYVGPKKKGQFQHSSFLSGGATIASGRLVARNGLLEATWPYSGHYRPTEENFTEFISFLEEHNVDLSNVKRFAIDDDIPPVRATTIDGKEKLRPTRSSHTETTTPSTNTESADTNKLMTKIDTSREKVEALAFKVGKRIPLSPKWTTGAGPRIGCVREYPPQLQFQALEQVNLSPRKPGPGPSSSSNRPIPSPRPTPKVHLSPRLAANMGLPSPRVVHVPAAAN